MILLQRSNLLVKHINQSIMSSVFIWLPKAIFSEIIGNVIDSELIPEHIAGRRIILMARHVTHAQKITYEPPHEKTNKMIVRPAKTPISLGIRPI